MMYTSETTYGRLCLNANLLITVVRISVYSVCKSICLCVWKPSTFNEGCIFYKYGRFQCNNIKIYYFVWIVFFFVRLRPRLWTRSAAICESLQSWKLTVWDSILGLHQRHGKRGRGVPAGGYVYEWRGREERTTLNVHEGRHASHGSPTAVSEKHSLSNILPRDGQRWLRDVSMRTRWVWQHWIFCVT